MREKNENILIHYGSTSEGILNGRGKEMQNKTTQSGLVLFSNQALQQEFVKENTYGILPS